MTGMRPYAKSSLTHALDDSKTRSLGCRPRTTASSRIRDARCLGRCPVLASLCPLLVVVVTCSGLKMIDLDAPESSQVGDTVKLLCSYELEADTGFGQTGRVKGNLQVNPARSQAEGERLYAVKWYKNELEFFRFMEQDWPQKSVLTMDGLTVDVHSSDNQSVVLTQVGLKSSGLYRCEVSTDAPNFVTKSHSRRLSVYSMPSKGPVIRLHGGFKQTKAPLSVALPGFLEISCTAHESKPVAQLDWIINDSLNLSSLEPTNWLAIERKRFFRLAREQESLAKAMATSIDSPVSMLDQQYELQQNGSEAVSSSNKSLVISNVSDYLDQLPEISTSWLNLTVSEELLRMIGHRDFATIYESKLSNNRLEKNIHRQFNKSKTIGSTTNSIYSNSPSKGASYARLVIQIKCIARVLSVPLTDSIKLRLESPNGSSSLRNHSTSMSNSNSLKQHQDSQRLQRNGSSAAIEAISFIGVGVSLVVIALCVKLTQADSLSLDIKKPSLELGIVQSG